MPDPAARHLERARRLFDGLPEAGTLAFSERLKDRIAAALAEAEAHVVGGPPGPFADCTDCGRPMVWNNPDQECPTWMCPRCCHGRMVRAEQAEAHVPAAAAARLKAEGARACAERFTRTSGMPSVAEGICKAIAAEFDKEAEDAE